MARLGSFSGARGFHSRGQLEPGKGGGVSSTAQGRPAAMAGGGRQAMTREQSSIRGGGKSEEEKSDLASTDGLSGDGG